MSCLLDTHALLWFLADDARLSERAKATICSEERAGVSCVSLWEIVLKKNLGKLRVESTAEEITALCGAKDIEVIGISPRALDRLADLPFIHRDPFDGLIVATALEEGMTIVTRDSIIPRYDVPTLW